MIPHLLLLHGRIGLRRPVSKALAAAYIQIPRYDDNPPGTIRIVHGGFTAPFVLGGGADKGRV